MWKFWLSWSLKLDKPQDSGLEKRKIGNRCCVKVLGGGHSQNNGPVQGGGEVALYSENVLPKRFRCVKHSY